MAFLRQQWVRVARTFIRQHAFASPRTTAFAVMVACCLAVIALLPGFRAGAVLRAELMRVESAAQAAQAPSTDVVTAQITTAPLDQPVVPAEAAAQAPAATEPRPSVAQLIKPVAQRQQAAEQQPPTFDGRPLRKARTIRMLTTAYSPDERSCGKWADGRTASGYSVWTNGMKLVAADTSLLPFGTVISVPGYNDGKPVPVLDRGGAIKGRRLDVLYPTHEIARQWGRQWIEVTVWEYAD